MILLRSWNLVFCPDYFSQPCASSFKMFISALATKKTLALNAQVLGKLLALR